MGKDKRQDGPCSGCCGNTQVEALPKKVDDLGWDRVLESSPGGGAPQAEIHV